jgi:hypothetical protein
VGREPHRGGLLAVAPCWFSGGSGAGTKYVSPPIACAVCAGGKRYPAAPSRCKPWTLSCRPCLRCRTHAPIVSAFRSLTRLWCGVGIHHVHHGREQREHPGLPCSRTVDIRRTGWTARCRSRHRLLLHGVLPAPDDGSPVNNVELAHSLEAALKRAGRPVDAKYNEPSGHNSFFTNVVQRDNEPRTMLDFYVRHFQE